MHRETASDWSSAPNRPTYDGASQETPPVPLPDDKTVALIAETYRLLGDPTRLKIVLTCLEGPIAVGDIAKATGASQSLVSHHLRHLRAARLVRFTRHNKQVLYEAADAHIANILSDMLDHALEPHDGDEEG